MANYKTSPGITTLVDEAVAADIELFAAPGAGKTVDITGYKFKRSVADVTDTATGSANAWELMELPYTATAAGWATLRLISSTTDAAGKGFADDFSAQ